MIDRELDQLLWDEVDGELTAEDRERLEAMLAAHPQAPGRRRELAALSKLLAQVEEVEPPPVLRRRIRDAIEAVAETRRERNAVVTPLRRPWARGFSVRWAYLAAGLLLGALGYHLLNGRLDRSEPLDVSRLYGALSSQGATGGGLEVGLGALDGTLTLYREGSVVVADLRLAHPGEVEIAFAREGGLALRRVAQSGAASSRVRVEAARVVVEIVGGGRLSSAFEIGLEAGSPMVVKVVADSDVVIQETVLPEKIPERS